MVEGSPEWQHHSPEALSERNVGKEDSVNSQRDDRHSSEACACGAGHCPEDTLVLEHLSQETSFHHHKQTHKAKETLSR